MYFKCKGYSSARLQSRTEVTEATMWEGGHYKKIKLPTKQIYRKHPKFVGKLIVCKFIDEFLSSSIITD